MNVERILKLADFLDTLPEQKFEMSSWNCIKYEDAYITNGNEVVSNWVIDDEKINLPFVDIDNCGTACCIAGWTLAMKNDFKSYNVIDNALDQNYSQKETTFHQAKEYLDLTDLEATRIFYIGSHTIWADYAQERNYNFCFDDDSFKNIKNSDAAYALRKIANNELGDSWTNDYDSNYEELRNVFSDINCGCAGCECYTW